MVQLMALMNWLQMGCNQVVGVRPAAQEREQVFETLIRQNKTPNDFNYYFLQFSRVLEMLSDHKLGS